MIDEKLREITQGLLNEGYSRGKLKLPMDREQSLYSSQAISQLKALVIESLGEDIEKIIKTKYIEWKNRDTNSMGYGSGYPPILNYLAKTIIAEMKEKFK